MIHKTRPPHVKICAVRMFQLAICIDHLPCRIRLRFRNLQMGVQGATWHRVLVNLSKLPLAA